MACCWRGRRRGVVLFADWTRGGRHAITVDGATQQIGGATERWVARSFWKDLEALFEQRGLAWKLYRAEVAEGRRNSGLGLVAPFFSVLLHVVLLGSVMALVFAEPIDVFLPFFAVSFPVWQAISAFVSDAAHANDKMHRYLSFPRVSGSIVHLVSGCSFLISMLLKAVAALLVIAATNPEVLVRANYPGAVGGIALLGVTLMAWAIPIAYCFDSIRLLRGFLAQMLFAVYLITPILWQPERLDDHRWIVDWNPVFHLVEIVRAPILQGVWPWTSIGVSGLLIIAGFAASRLLFGANRRLIIYRWIA